MDAARKPQRQAVLSAEILRQLGSFLNSFPPVCYIIRLVAILAVPINEDPTPILSVAPPELIRALFSTLHLPLHLVSLPHIAIFSNALSFPNDLLATDSDAREFYSVFLSIMHSPLPPIVDCASFVLSGAASRRMTENLKSDFHPDLFFFWEEGRMKFLVDLLANADLPETAHVTVAILICTLHSGVPLPVVFRPALELVLHQFAPNDESEYRSGRVGAIMHFARTKGLYCSSSLFFSFSTSSLPSFPPSPTNLLLLQRIILPSSPLTSSRSSSASCSSTHHLLSS
jgi:hypothetical protein